VSIGWLRDGSEPSIRRAVHAALPGLVITRLEIRPRYSSPNPLYWSSSAVINDAFVVKFAWSEVRAIRLHREAVLIERLHLADRELRLPELIAVTDDPVAVVTRRLDGEPLSWGGGSDLRGPRAKRVAVDLAEFLVTLHGTPAESVLHDLAVVVPTAQGNTSALRARYPRLVTEARASQVLTLCDWVDRVLDDVYDPVLVHGDLHGHNQLWNFTTGELVAVVDLEECGLGDPHFDFRYLPGNSPSTDLVVAVVDAYEQRSQRRLRLDRIIAWHALSVLGDAMWRTEAGLELPGGGNANTYVDDLERRMSSIAVGP
jgi:aminoglycoside phosphotransferase (APT) family kinase protein